MGTAEVVELARRYRESRLRRGIAAPGALVDALANRYRARRWYRLEAIVARLDALPASGVAPDASAAEALENATRDRDVSAPRDGSTHVRWRAACFDVLVRDVLNAGERVADLRLRPGQRAVLVPTVDSTTLGVSASSRAPWSAQQQRALDDLARVRDTVAAGHPLDVAMAPLPAGDEWTELSDQLAARRSWRRTTP
ncbi:MAG: hypothetical protein QOI55_1751 [Actinomycetota bacterium]|nr:hypothetical protein [Actinomycetota bacterium]